MIYLKNETDPVYPYYHVERKTQKEFFFLYGYDIQNESYFDEDFDVPYPEGTLLCKSLNILSEIYALIKKVKNEYNDEEINLKVDVPHIIKTYLPTGKDRNTSIDDLRMFIESDLYQNDIEKFDYDSVKFSQLLNCLSYADLCTKDKKYSNLDYLVNFSVLNELRLKSSFKALNSVPSREVEYTMTPWEIKMYFDNQNRRDEYDNTYQIRPQAYVELFGLDSISDFILVSLSELFAIGKTVNRCELCGSFFIPKRSDTKYCDGPFPGAPNRICRQEAKLQKQNQRIRLSETERQYRSISQMMRKRVSDFYADGDDVSGKLATDELVNFQRRHKELRAKYKNFEIPEWEYSNWLKSFYKRKYK